MTTLDPLSVNIELLLRISKEIANEVDKLIAEGNEATSPIARLSYATSAEAVNAVGRALNTVTKELISCNTSPSLATSLLQSQSNSPSPSPVTEVVGATGASSPTPRATDKSSSGTPKAASPTPATDSSVTQSKTPPSKG